MIKPVQTAAAKHIVAQRPQFTYSEAPSNVNIILYKRGEVEQLGRHETRYVVGPIATRFERRHSDEMGGDWFRVKSYSTKKLAEKNAS